MRMASHADGSIIAAVNVMGGPPTKKIVTNSGAELFIIIICMSLIFVLKKQRFEAHSFKGLCKNGPISRHGSLTSNFEYFGHTWP